MGEGFVNTQHVPWALFHHVNIFLNISGIYSIQSRYSNNTFFAVASPRIFEWGTNRRQVANLSPKYHKNGKRHRIWTVSFPNLEGTSPPKFFTGGDASLPPPPPAFDALVFLPRVYVVLSRFSIGAAAVRRMLVENSCDLPASYHTLNIHGCLGCGLTVSADTVNEDAACLPHIELWASQTKIDDIPKLAMRAKNTLTIAVFTTHYIWYPIWYQIWYQIGYQIGYQILYPTFSSKQLSQKTFSSNYSLRTHDNGK